MAEIVLFHSAYGLDAGVHAVAALLEADGHTVHTPDVYEGLSFGDAEEGVAHLDEVGFPTVLERAIAACADFGEELVFAGMSMGAGIAQQMGKNDSRARGALLLHGGGFPKQTRWSARVPVQIHFTVDDVWREHGAQENLLESAARAGAQAELFLYPGSAHLFSDPTSPEHMPENADLLTERALNFLTRIVSSHS